MGSFRPFAPAPALCERCWRVELEHAQDGACPPQRADPSFGIGGW